MTSKYSIGTILKAVLAFVVALLGSAGAAAHGSDVTTLDFGTWLGALIPALTAGVALLHNPQPTGEAAPATTAAKQITDVITSATAAQADLVKQAVEGIQAVQAATGDLTKLIPGGSVLSAVPGANVLGGVENTVLTDAQAAAAALGMGPLAKQVIGLVPRF